MSAQGALFDQRFAESHARLHTFAHDFEGAFGHADAPHAVMNAAGSQPSLCDLKTSSFTQQHIRDRHPNILENDFSMSMGRVIVSKYSQQPLDLHSR